MPASHSPTNPSKDATILVVEDEAAVRLMIAEALRAEGFGVMEAASGDEALAVLESGTRVNLVFTDVIMPGKMDGLSLVSRLRVTRPDLKLAIGSALSPEWRPPILSICLSANPMTFRAPSRD